MVCSVFQLYSYFVVNPRFRMPRASTS
jgi:hypothetical protein